MKLIPKGNNQTVVELADGKEVLFSYQTPVAAFIPGEGYYKTAKKWSPTTTRHINKWVENTTGVKERPQDFFDRLFV